MDQEEHEYFEYLLNVPTAVKNNDTTVFYMDRAKWYQFKVKLDNEKMIAHLKKLYFQVQLDFVSENLRKNREQLFDKWHELHPGERLLDIDPNQLENGKVIYDQNNVNMVRLLTDSAEEMQFSLRINCVHSQFTFENQEIDSNLSSQSVFYLIFTVFSSDSKLDTNLCQIKTFWTGLAEPNFEIYRCRLIDTNPNVFCDQKSKLLKTILSTNSSEFVENESENISSPTSSNKKKNKRNKLFNQDDREFVCFLRSRSNQLGEILLEKGKEYILSIERMNFARPGEKICVSIGLQFEQNELAQILSNWSLRNQRKTLIDFNLDSSQLENTVFDVYQENLYTINLIWIPEDKIKLALRFNFLSSEFAHVNLSSKLVVETSSFNTNYKIEKSTCSFTVSEASESYIEVENDSVVTILSNQSFSQSQKTTLTTQTIQTRDEAVQVNQDENFAKMLVSIENFKSQQKTWAILAIVVLAIILACLIKQTQREMDIVIKANLDTITDSLGQKDEILKQMQKHFDAQLEAIENYLKIIQANVDTSGQAVKNFMLLKNKITIYSLKFNRKNPFYDQEIKLSPPGTIYLYKLTENELKQEVSKIITEHYPQYKLGSLNIDYLKNGYKLVSDDIVRYLPSFSTFDCTIFESGDTYLG